MQQAGLHCAPAKRHRGTAAAPTLRVFSNWELMRVIMPMEAMKDRRLRTCVMPRRSMRKRLMVQFPLLMALSRPAVMMSVRMQRLMSKSSCRLALLSTVSAWPDTRSWPEDNPAVMLWVRMRQSTLLGLCQLCLLGITSALADPEGLSALYCRPAEHSA